MDEQPQEAKTDQPEVHENEVPDEVLKDVRRLLNELKEPIIETIPEWLSCCITARRRENPELSLDEALRAECDTVLEMLNGAPSTSTYSNILRSRFWEGLRALEVHRKELRDYSESAYYTKQREAIEKFAFLLWKKEQVCRQALQNEVLPIVVPDLQIERPKKIQSTYTRWIIAGLILLGMVGIGSAVFAFLRPTQSICSVIIQDRPRNPGAFLPSQGVTAYTVENTDGTILNNSIRALAIDTRGLWFGYLPGNTRLVSSIGFHNEEDWIYCDQDKQIAGRNINAVAVDNNGIVWIAMEHEGVLSINQGQSRIYTTGDGLPSNMTYGLTVDDKNDVWVGTWEGVAKFDREIGKWVLFYNTDNRTLSGNNHVHAVGFDSVGTTWIGHIDGGLSVRHADGSWEHLTATPGALGGNALRYILVRPASANEPESVWFATGDGGMSRFEQGVWTVYRKEDGLLDNDVRTLALDKYRRVWAATGGGVVYFDGAQWTTYTTLPSLSIAFGPPCREKQCPYDDDHVWTGTQGFGLTHSRVPLPDQAIDVVSINYPKIVAPGETFYPEIVVRIRTPYTLNSNGDFLSHIDAKKEDRFGSSQTIPVKRFVNSNELYSFIPDKPFTAPQLISGEQNKICVSTWKLWMSGRYINVPIILKFTVQRG